MVKPAAHTDSPDDGTGKTCLGRRMHCPNAFSGKFFDRLTDRCWPYSNGTQDHVAGCKVQVIFFSDMSD